MFSSKSIFCPSSVSSRQGRLCEANDGKAAMRIHTRAAVVFMIALLLPAAASADDLDFCRSDNKTAPVTAAILDACTRLIASGRYTGRDLAGIMLNRGNAYYNGQDYPRAIADYDEAIRLDPKASAAFSQRGNAYYAKGDLPHALADFNQAIALDMNNSDAILGRGTLRLEAGDPDRAIIDFNAALLFKPTAAVYAAYAAAFRNRGTAFAQKGDQDHAIADFNQVIRLNPEDAAAFIGRSAAYKAKGDLVRAAADRDAALHLEQRIPDPPPH
jgi:tetratricopeptide (TPR) repeat protein